MCAVIIGTGTTVTTSLFPSGGITSVSFGTRPQMNRLWELGSWSPYDTYVISQKELSITAYGKKEDGQGGSQSFSVLPSTSCTNANSIIITVNPGACETAVAPFSDTFYPTSYSYSKEIFGFGTENWSFTTEQEIDNWTGTIKMLRGISTGQMLTGDGIMSSADMGVVIDDSASRDSLGNYIDGTTGSVNAGFPGLGEIATQREIIVTSVGQSEGKSDGLKGQVSVTIPMNPVYL